MPETNEPDPTAAPAPSPADTPAPADIPVPADDAQASAEAAPPPVPAPDNASPASPATLSPAETAERLKSLFPALFAGPAKPIKLRIQADIQERAPGQFTKAALSAFLRRYTGSTSYLIVLTRAPQRLDLDGQPAGEISAEHRQAAVDELARRRSVHDARRQAEEASRQAEEAGRRERALLLRTFESTTLTKDNFCALKGLAPEALDAQLAQAREEARQWREQQAMQPNRGAGHPGGQPDRRHEGRNDGHPGPRRDGGDRPPRQDARPDRPREGRPTGPGRPDERRDRRGPSGPSNKAGGRPPRSPR